MSHGLRRFFFSQRWPIRQAALSILVLTASLLISPPIQARACKPVDAGGNISPRGFFDAVRSSDCPVVDLQGARGTFALGSSVRVPEGKTIISTHELLLTNDVPFDGACLIEIESTGGDEYGEPPVTRLEGLSITTARHGICLDSDGETPAVHIENCDIKSLGVGIRISGSGEHSIRGNSVSDFSSIELDKKTSALFDVDRSMIVPGEGAIHLADTYLTTVSSNSIDAPRGGYGVELEGGQANTLRDNTIGGGGESVVLLGAARTDRFGRSIEAPVFGFNTIEKNELASVAIGYKNRLNHIRRNRFNSDSDHIPIDIRSHMNHIESNVIKGHAQAAISAAESGGGNLIEGNAIATRGEYGIFLATPANYLVENEIACGSNIGVGVEVRGEKNYLEGNAISGCTDSGARLRSGRSVLVSNRVFGNRTGLNYDSWSMFPNYLLNNDVFENDSKPIRSRFRQMPYMLGNRTRDNGAPYESMVDAPTGIAMTASPDWTILSATVPGDTIAVEVHLVDAADPDAATPATRAIFAVRKARHGIWECADGEGACRVHLLYAGGHDPGSPVALTAISSEGVTSSISDIFSPGDAAGAGCFANAACVDDLDCTAENMGRGPFCELDELVRANPTILGDDDGDRIANLYDNCPFVGNPLQVDRDLDVIGDACDDDMDGDGVLNWIEDALGMDESHPDSDQDGLCDGSAYGVRSDAMGDFCEGAVDAEPLTGEVTPYDYRRLYFARRKGECHAAGFAGLIDDRYDEDGIPPSIDNCPWEFNPEQEDSDGDGIGDACECDREAFEEEGEYDSCMRRLRIGVNRMSYYFCSPVVCFYYFNGVDVGESSQADLEVYADGCDTNEPPRFIVRDDGDDELGGGDAPGTGNGGDDEDGVRQTEVLPGGASGGGDGEDDADDDDGGGGDGGPSPAENPPESGGSCALAGGCDPNVISILLLAILPIAILDTWRPARHAANKRP